MSAVLDLSNSCFHIVIYIIYIGVIHLVKWSDNLSTYRNVYNINTCSTSLYTLPPTPNLSPYFFTLVQKVKIGHKKFMI